jgi:hypothetical protein
MATNEGYSYQDLTLGSTGPISVEQSFRIAHVPFGKYEIWVWLTEDGKFVDIAEVRINRDFLSPTQRIEKSGNFDVDEFYRE